MTGRKKMPGIFKFSKEKLIKNFVEINVMQIRSNPNKALTILIMKNFLN